MSYMFYLAWAFNADVSAWDTSSVTNMRQMFASAKAFNADISAWDTSSVTSMFKMFSWATAAQRGHLCVGHELRDRHGTNV